MLLQCGHHQLDLSSPVVMGILNVTPDSFSDGGRFTGLSAAVEHALAMVDAGAAIIDVGGESTRPGAAAVSAAEEIRRVAPVIEALVARTTAIISVDASKAAVLRAAVEAGATMINDVRALQEEGAIEVAAATKAAVCLMHMQGDPRTMQIDPHYDNVVTDVTDFLASRVQACENAGIARGRMVIDPGIGFGKRVEHNLQLLAAVPELRALQLPILIGVSRKSMFGALLGRPVEQRLAGGLAATTAAVLGGASIVRTHDVAQTLDAVKIAAALNAAGYRTLRN